jgi:sugar (pentulose or hexulose) kinase
MRSNALFTGLDIGTSGARATVIDFAGKVVSDGQCAMSSAGPDYRDPYVWLKAAKAALAIAFADIDTSRIASISVDGTSGTMLPIDKNGAPLAKASMYNDPCTDTQILEKISENAPITSAAHGATSGLARALSFCQELDAYKIIHQADWIAGQLCGTYTSDENNSLKTGYDPVEGRWPHWIENVGLDLDKLPSVEEPGCAISHVTSDFASEFDLLPHVVVVAGTTDGCASFLATGAEDVGDGVTALGTTLTIKLLSESPIFSPENGIYSHKILGKWLAGGASNSGGNVLLSHFDASQIVALSKEINAEVDSPLDYYPLSKVGERFPIADPKLPPRLTPRPACESEFLKGILQGMAEIERLGYSRLSALGGPKLSTVRTVGGGSKNKVWARLRERKLKVPMLIPNSDEAAYGTALLARKGVNK